MSMAVPARAQRCEPKPRFLRLSICIPTYNRSTHLANCLESIRVSRLSSAAAVQVCVSDNASPDDTESVVRAAQEGLTIEYRRNSRNIGIPANFLQVVGMAAGEFVWLVGDDDLLLPPAIDTVCRLIEEHRKADFFFVNSFHLTTEYVLSFPQPFSTSDLPADMTPVSGWSKSGEMPFMDLVNPKVSFDFLGGMFLAVFRRANWLAHVDAISEAALTDSRTFSALDNTFPHTKIFARAFARSDAFLCATPLSVCLTGTREWAPMYPMVKSVRLVEMLEEYRKNGLPLLRYVRCRNFALSSFVPDFAYMWLHKETSGYAYVSPAKLILSNCLYPNLYLSVLYYVVQRARR